MLTHQCSGVWGYTFLKTPWNFSFCYFTPGNSRQNKAQPLDIPQICVRSLWKFQGQKQRPLEIPHYFFLGNHGNSTSFLINPWKFHMLFLWYPLKFHILNPLVWIFSGITHWKLRTYFFEKPPLNFSFYYFTPGNSRQNKTPPLEIPQIFVRFLGNSKVKNQDPWKYHMSIIFSWSPLEIPLRF